MSKITTIRFLVPMLLALFVGCARDFSECAGPALDLGELNRLRSAAFASGPRGYLVVPNPIDATGIRNIQASDSRLQSALDAFMLPGLSGSRLENSFFKIRQQTYQDALTGLATANASGEFKFAVSDVHYSEVMAYHSVTALKAYVEALGFKLAESRPLYIMVRAKDADGDDDVVNAYYDHNYLNPNLPRMMKLFGNGTYAPGMDRDMYWHELGHYLNESISGEVGMDYAVDNGAVYSEASALHECLADYIAESAGNTPFIGKWIARNFDDVAVGDPLRSALDDKSALDFKEISKSAADGTMPQRYVVAEWCSRVLWDLRSQFVKEDSEGGSAQSDRLIYSALAMVKRDTSFSEFKRALSSADESLHCGLHSRSIDKAFEKRGFTLDAPQMGASLDVAVVPKGAVTDSDGAIRATTLSAGKTVIFQMRITNPSSTSARNVRVKLDALDGAFRPTTYQQSLGDLLPGETLVIGDGGFPFDYSVSGELSSGAPRGTRYKLRVLMENGTEIVKEGELVR